MTVRAPGRGAEPRATRRARRHALALPVSLVVLLVVVALASSIGSVSVTPGELLAALGRGLRGRAEGAIDAIVWNIRLPRVLLGAVVGGGLALAGAVFQGVFRNPLADPYLIGTASGAGFGATLVMALGAGVPILARVGAPLVAFVAALATVLVVTALAREGRSLPTVRLILAGVVVGSILTAATSFVLLGAREQAAGVLARLLGSFAFASWKDVAVVAAFTAPAAVLAVTLARALDVLQLGEEGAAQLGLPVERVKLALLALATLITAAAVSVAGIIGFVGLITPHAARMAFGPAHRRLLPLALVWGGAFTVLADVLARTALSPAEVPVGVVTALAGGPFFLALLRRRPEGV
ncbi:MAG: iron ABC transporter permease [Trueperaceae bacterium]